MPHLQTPRLQLVDFNRLHVNDGQTISVTCGILSHQMAVWDNDANSYITEPGMCLQLS